MASELNRDPTDGRVIPPACETCPYWGGYGIKRELTLDENFGCHRFPRGVHPDVYVDRDTSGWQDERRGEHPFTNCEDWCGEHPDFPAYLASLKAPAESDHPDILSTPVHRIISDVAIGNLLEGSRIDVVGDLIKKTKDEVRNIRMVGPTRLHEIRVSLAAVGLHLAGDEQWKE